MAGNHELVLARLASGGPTHRYDAGQAVTSLTGGDPDSVYKAVERLERQGYVVDAGEGTRAVGTEIRLVRLFDVTDAGLARIRAWMRSELPAIKPHSELWKRMRFATVEDLPVLLEVTMAALRRCTRALGEVRDLAPEDTRNPIAEAGDLLEDEGNAAYIETDIECLRSASEILERLIRETRS